LIWASWGQEKRRKRKRKTPIEVGISVTVFLRKNWRLTYPETCTVTHLPSGRVEI
jgi:hypothetical protein